MNVLGQNHVNVATSYNNIGLVYVKMNKLQECYDYFRRSYLIKLKVFGDKHNKTLLALNIMQKYEHN